MLVKTRNNVILPSFVDAFFGTDVLNGFNDTTKYSQPAINIAEGETFYKVEIAFPGVDKDKFELDVNDKVLSISVKQENKTETTENTADEPKIIYKKREFIFATFVKQFTLPEMADVEAISAEHKNGILTVTIPKKVETKVEARKISVN